MGQRGFVATRSRLPCTTRLLYIDLERERFGVDVQLQVPPCRVSQVSRTRSYADKEEGEMRRSIESGWKDSGMET